MAYSKLKLSEQKDLRLRIDGWYQLKEIERLLTRQPKPDDFGWVDLRIKTRLALLKKVLPDLKAVEVTGEAGGAVEIIWRMEPKPE